VNRNSNPKPASTAMHGALAANVVVGWLEPKSSAERLFVGYAGNPHGPLPARTTLVLSGDVLTRAVAARQGALLVFENGDATLPILIGLIQTAAATAFGELLEAARTPASDAPPQARLEGERVVVRAQREIAFECGDAALTLRRDGKVLIRGAYVETYSKGINRIKGGAVKIN